MIDRIPYESLDIGKVFSRAIFRLTALNMREVIIYSKKNQTHSPTALYTNYMITETSLIPYPQQWNRIILP